MPRIVGVSDINLIVAALDLNLVRQLRRAMAGSAIGGPPGAGIGPSARFEPRPRVEPEPRIEPRKRIEPAPRFEPRQVVHPKPRVEPAPPPAPPDCPEQPVRLESPLQPPWKVLPWETPALPKPKLKIVLHQPDVVMKGLLIDFFI